MEPLEQLGAVIKNARVRNGLSQEQLAEKLGVSPTHIKHMESGRRKPSVDVLFQLARQLHFSLDALLFPQRCGADAQMQKVQALLADCTPDQLSLIAELIRAVRGHSSLNND